MMNTAVQGTYNRLFEGITQNVVKCVNVDFESTREEKFAMISLNVKGNKSIEDSFKEYVLEEELKGDD